ncbi:MAG: hypothetical protein GWO41_01275 [candidate division Zixibacteria bacterium]|nr:hypothetical protein [candidate division Zixibacteria bacterium]NIW40581.1 hypothetical protein [candidate division Zixibacteria bacterium]NIW99612.1 hypothetical protein [Phycisphaerae bacterium]
MAGEVSKLRLYILRAFYLLMFAGLGSTVWPTIISPGELWNPEAGVT